MLAIQAHDAVFLVTSCMFVDYLNAGDLMLNVVLHSQVMKLSGY